MYITSWSSVVAHIAGRDDALVRTAPLARCVADMGAFFETDVAAEATKKLRAAMRTGRPLGASAWVKALEKSEGRALVARPPGRPRRLTLPAAGEGRLEAGGPG